MKNVAKTYSLEHEGESVLFDQLFKLLNSNLHNDDSLRREIASCTGAIQTSLGQHMSKEEEQVIEFYHVLARPNATNSHSCISLSTSEQSKSELHFAANIYSIIKSMFQLIFIEISNLCSTLHIDQDLDGAEGNGIVQKEIPREYSWFHLPKHRPHITQYKEENSILYVYSPG